MLVRMWRNWNPLYTIGETVEYTIGPIIENSMEVLQKIKNRTASNVTSWYLLKGKK